MPESLSRYEALRRTGLEGIIRRSNRTGRQKPPSNDPPREVRDQLLPHLFKRTSDGSATEVRAR